MSPTLRDWYRSAFGQALIGGMLLWAALPPLNIRPLAWIAPVWWVTAHPPREASALAGGGPAGTRWGTQYPGSGSAALALGPACRGRALFCG